MLNRRIRLPFVGVLLCLLVAGCGTKRSGTTTSLSDMLISYKNEFLRAQALTTFEEFVRYVELDAKSGMMSIGDVTIEASTQLTDSSKLTAGGEFTASYPIPGVKFSGSKEVQVQDQEGGKVQVKLNVLSANDTQKVKDGFEKMKAKKNKLYGVVWYEASTKKSYDAMVNGAFVSEDPEHLCGWRGKNDPFPICVKIRGYGSDNRQAFAYPLTETSLYDIVEATGGVAFFAPLQ